MADARGKSDVSSKGNKNAELPIAAALGDVKSLAPPRSIASRFQERGYNVAGWNQQIAAFRGEIPVARPNVTSYYAVSTHHVTARRMIV